MSIDRYFDHANSDLLALIPPDAHTVLEIGCGAGALAEAYRRINPTVEWWGVESNEEARIEADARDINLISEDAESAFKGEQYRGNPNVDCLIFGDVLEHLRDPWTVLRSAACRVKPGGFVLASIPNVGHWSIIVSLMRGEWDYQDSGLLDRTHLRFFTLKSVREMFASADLEILDIRGRAAVTEDRVEYQRLIDSRAAEWFGCEDFAKQTRAYQYLVRAIKPPAEVKPLHIHAITAEGCCARPRIEEPMAMLATIPGVRCSTGPTPSPASNVVIIQRARNAHLDWWRAWMEDRLIIAEIDDDPESLEGLPECDFLPLRAVHAVQVSTEALAETVRRWNPEVMVFPNQIADLPPLREPRTGPPTIFYGAQNRESDWAPIMPTLNRVLSDHPEVTVCVIHDEAFYRALEVPRNRKCFHPFVAYETYREVLGACDIALLPLEPTRFNRCKSDLKFLECAAEGVVCLASETVYGEAMGFIAGMNYHNAEVFEMDLRHLIARPDVRQQMASVAYAYIRNHRLLSQHYRERHEWYLDLLNRKESLHQALLERVPELAHLPVSV